MAAVDAGADDFLRKPFSPRVLLRTRRRAAAPRLKARNSTVVTGSSRARSSCTNRRCGSARPRRFS